VKTITLSTMVPAAALGLDSFLKQTQIQVQHEQYTWDDSWKNILQIALYQKGPEVSEVGSTWLDNLGDMNSLRLFTASELRALGDASAFFPGAWHRPAAGEQLAFSIPWTVDTRIIYYRKDWLEKAGLNPENAFNTPEALVSTLQSLQAAGFQHPLAMATHGITFHNLATFVWGRKGSFRSPDMKKMALLEPEARQGMLDYFQLHPFIHPEYRLLDYYGADHCYLEGKAAVLLSGQWLMQTIKNQESLPEAVRQQTGYAIPPGVPYLGGTHLVFWRHAIREPEAMRLIAHLTNPITYQNMIQVADSFPARLEAYKLPPFSTDPDYRLVSECLQRGQAFRTARRWAAVELRLNAFYEQLWEDIFANPQLDLAAEIEKRTREMSSHVERSILSN
jgi:multiple sugar transport system substrate-binding protein